MAKDEPELSSTREFPEDLASKPEGPKPLNLYTMPGPQTTPLQDGGKLTSIGGIPPNSAPDSTSHKENVLRFPDGIVLDDKHVVNYLCREAAQRVYEHVEKREARWRWVLTTLFALAGLFGYQTLSRLIVSAVGDATKGFPSQIDEGIQNVEARVVARVPDLVTAGVDTQLGELRSSMESQIAFLALTRLAKELEDRLSSFTNMERDAVMEQLQLILTAPTVSQRAEFTTVLNQIIGVFDSASLDASIDKIDDMARSEIVKSPELIQRMVMHYGPRLLGAGVPHPDWDQGVKERFELYVNSAKSAQASEGIRPYVLLAEFAKSGNQRAPAVTALTIELEYWPLDDQATFFAHLIMLSKASHYVKPGAKSFTADNMAVLANEYRSAYSVELSKMLRVPKLSDTLNSLVFGTSAQLSTSVKEALAEASENR